MPKTAVFVTLRYGDYYTPAFLQQQKRLHGLRIVLVTDEASVDAIPIGAREAIDVLHVLPGTRSHGMQTVFSVEDLQRVIETERATFPGRDVRVVEDPAVKYYEQSRRDREAYKAALKMVGDESSWSVESLPEHHHDFRGQEGNSRSRSSFDFSTFRSKT